MTIIAGDGLVGSVQRKVCSEIVIESCRVPRFTAVARTTVVAAMPFVIIVFEVTTDTSHIHDIVERVFAVTVGAGQGRVLKLERKVRVAAVIEAGVVPGTGVVAILTLFTAASLVRIILGVTAVTSGRRILMCLISVTVSAGRF